MVFHWSLSDSKSLQISRTRLSILAVLCNAVVWIFSTRPPISKSSWPFNNPLVIVPNAPITIGSIVTFMFHSFIIIIIIIICYVSFSNFLSSGLSLGCLNGTGSNFFIISIIFYVTVFGGSAFLLAYHFIDIIFFRL